MVSLARKLAMRDQAAAAHAGKRKAEQVSRTTQVAHSTVPVGDVDVPVVDVAQDATSAAAALPGVQNDVATAGDDAYEAWDQSAFAKELAEELGVNVGEMSGEVAAAALAAASAQSAADAAQLEAETARSEATSKSAAAEAAAKLYAEAEAAAARLAAVAVASGDASDKAAAAEAAAVLVAAADATAKANAAEAAAKADAAAAQSTADTALSDAAAAQVAAGSATTIANQAQATASGKSKIFRSTSAPSGTGTADGDKWEQYDTLGAGGKLTGTWAWFDGSWRSTVIAETYLPLVNIGSGTYGTLAGARLAATAIDGMTITGALIRTAPSGQRMQFDVNGLRAFNASGLETANLSSAGGGMRLNGTMRFVNEAEQLYSVAFPGELQAWDDPGTINERNMFSAQPTVFYTRRQRLPGDGGMTQVSGSAGTDEAVMSVWHLANGPVGYRPSHKVEAIAGPTFTGLRFEHYGTENTYGSVRFANGGFSFGNPVTFQGDTDWAQASSSLTMDAPQLKNGWGNRISSLWDGVWLLKKGGIVYVYGCLTKSSAYVSEEVLFTLPVGFRPPFALPIQATYALIGAHVIIRPNGDVVTSRPGTAADAAVLSMGGSFAV